jgi:hypothetical protein
VLRRLVSDRFELEKHVLFDDGVITASSLRHV